MWALNTLRTEQKRLQASPECGVPRPSGPASTVSDVVPRDSGERADHRCGTPVEPNVPSGSMYAFQEDTAEPQRISDLGSQKVELKLDPVTSHRPRVSDFLTPSHTRPVTLVS